MTTTEPRIRLDDGDRPEVRIFLSVASVDEDLWTPLIERLKSTLSIVSEYRFATFDMRQILPSEDFLGVIERELQDYHLGFGFLSPAYFASDVIRNLELATFVDRKNARFVPVMLENLPKFGTALPEIASRQIFGFNEPWSAVKERRRQAWINALADDVVAVLDKYGDRR